MKITKLLITNLITYETRGCRSCHPQCTSNKAVFPSDQKSVTQRKHSDLHRVSNELFDVGIFRMPPKAGKEKKKGKIGKKGKKGKKGPKPDVNSEVESDD